jgi:hypothetical protein
VQHTAITLTYKIKADGSQRLGEIMVLVFLFFVVLCWLYVIAHDDVLQVIQTWRA